MAVIIDDLLKNYAKRSQIEDKISDIDLTLDSINGESVEGESISAKLSRLSSSKNSFVNALFDKGFIAPEKLSDFYKVIDEIPVDSNKDLLFIDYDGSLLYAYSTEDGLNLTELPPLPTLTGYTNQGWNYTLTQIKSELNAGNKVTVGCNYATTDGKTRVKIVIPNKEYKSVTISYVQTASYGIQLDWGDGTVESFGSTTTDNRSHTYSPTSYPAEYTIEFTVNNGNLKFTKNILYYTNTGSTSPRAAGTSLVKDIQLGNTVIQLGANFLANNPTIHSLPVPTSVTSIGSGAFQSCYRLTGLVIPPNVSDLHSNLFYKASEVKRISIPSGVTSIESQCFGYCNDLSRIDFPLTVTSLGYLLFTNSTELSSFKLRSGITYDYSTFNGCTGLYEVILPSDMTAIPNRFFQGCTSLLDINIPSTVTSIGNYVFTSCESLTQLKFPSGLTSIGTNAFESCFGVKFYDFTLCTQVPTLGTEGFKSTNPDKKIVVPDDLYNNWVAAENWSSLLSSIVKKSDYEGGS